MRRLLEPEGITLPDLDTPYRASLAQGHADAFVARERANGGWIPIEAIEPGDVLLFRTPGCAALHVAVALPDGQMAHARPRLGVVIENLAPIWSCFLVGAYRHTRCTS